MKIFYAAGNRLGSFYQMKRFLDSVKSKGYDIRTAAYKKSMGNLDVDYTLDCLLNFTHPDRGIAFNGNYAYYHNEIKRFAPDLVISDMEIYSSVLATELKIKLWQFSPVCMYYGLKNEVKYNTDIHKNNAHLIDSDHRKNDYINHILKNSERRFVVSHVCDSDKHDMLSPDYEWVRPDFILGENKERFDNLLVITESNKDVINHFKNKKSIMFSPFIHEEYRSMKVESIYSEESYKNCLETCGKFICDGAAMFLADAFYNRKYSLMAPKHNDIESIICSYLNEHCGFGSLLNDNNYDASGEINIKINDDVKFISEHIGVL